MNSGDRDVDTEPGRRAAGPDPDGAGRALAELPPGARGRVVTVTDDGSSRTARQLRDLGFTPGTVVEVVRRAPLRDPVVFRVKDYDLCLRRAQAACVRVVEVGP